MPEDQYKEKSSQRSSMETWELVLVDPPLPSLRGTLDKYPPIGRKFSGVKYLKHGLPETVIIKIKINC